MTVERLLTLPEYMALAKVGRSTVFQWIRTGKLKEGVHFVYLGDRALRFPYPLPLPASRRRETPSVSPPPALVPVRRDARVNLGYGL
jgi:predicted DNA-binding transcriptional regulator AlpA